MTETETVFWRLADEHASPKFGYSVISLGLNPAGEAYTLRLNRLSSPEPQPKTFTVFVDQVAESIATRELPEDLILSLAHELDSNQATWK